MPSAVETTPSWHQRSSTQNCRQSWQRRSSLYFLGYFSGLDITRLPHKSEFPPSPLAQKLPHVRRSCPRGGSPKPQRCSKTMFSRSSTSASGLLSFHSGTPPHKPSRRAQRDWDNFRLAGRLPHLPRAKLSDSSQGVMMPWDLLWHL